MTATRIGPAITHIVQRLSDGERSSALAIEALIVSADSRGSAAFDDVAIAYRDEHLRTLRLEGKDAAHEAGRLSLDEVRGYLSRSILPRLADQAVIEVPASVSAPGSRIQLTPTLWAEIEPLREEVVEMVRSTGEHPVVRDGQAPATQGGSTLEARGLVKIYRRRKVVNDVALKLRQGEIVGLLGPNGAGKTTTFYMIVGLIQPAAGSIVFDGDDISNMAMYQRARRGIGYLAQEPSVFRKLSVEDNILAILETLPISASERVARLEHLLDELGLRRLRKIKAFALSGGERRRLEITRALVTQPKFMMLDEPFAGVDPIAVHDIQTIVAGLRYRGIGVLISDHNVEQTLDIVDRAYIMFDGQVKVSGTVRDLVFDDTVARIYLGPVLTARLRQRFAGSATQGAKT